MNRLYLLLILLVLFSACDSETKPPNVGATDLLTTLDPDPDVKDLPDIDERMIFEGTIDQYPIVMELDRKGDSILGKYRYLKQESFLELRGSLDSDRKITLREYTETGEHTGTFRGYSGYRDRFVGDWVKSNNQEALLFALRMKENQWFRPSPFVASEQLVVKGLHKERIAPDSSCSIHIYYPEISGLPVEVAEFINAVLAPPADSTLERQIQECAADDIARELELPGSEMEESYEVNGVHGYVLSVSQHYFAYFSGAAHGNYGSKTINFDLRTGQILTPADLFRPEADTLLNKLISDRLKSIYPEDHGIFSFEGVTEQQNYVFEADSLGTYFNPYEIAPYAAGQVLVKFSYDEVAAVLKPLQ